MPQAQIGPGVRFQRGMEAVQAMSFGRLLGVQVIEAQRNIEIVLVF